MNINALDKIEELNFKSVMILNTFPPKNKKQPIISKPKIFLLQIVNDIVK